MKLSDRFTGLVKGNVGLVFGMQGEFDNSGSSGDLEVEAALGFGVGATSKSFTVIDKTTITNIEDLPSGSYLLSLNIGGELITAKFIKSN